MRLRAAAFADQIESSITKGGPSHTAIEEPVNFINSLSSDDDHSEMKN